MPQPYYILKHRKPIPVSMLECYAWRSNMHRSRIRSQHIGKLWVSTVFIGIAHQLFETMIFGLPDDIQYQARCDTHRQALKMHQNAVLYAKGYTRGLYERQMRTHTLP